MSFPQRLKRIPADLLRDEGGNILATVVIVSMLIGSLSALALSTGQQAQVASTSDRNHDQALAAAEAGLHEAIVQFGQRAIAGNTQPFSVATSSHPPVPNTPGGTTCATSSPNPMTPATYPNGSFYTCLTKDPTTGYPWIDSEGSVGGTHYGRKRHIRVQLLPPDVYPNNGKYALFSYTSITLKNGDNVAGDVWANQSFTFDNNSTVNGNITAATGWIDMNKNGAGLTGNGWSGGYNPAGWAIDMGGNTVTGSLKASSSVPSCAGETGSNYKINGTGTVTGGVTTFGTMPSGTHGTPYLPNTCTAAPATQPMPPFNFNKANYGCQLSGGTWACPSTYHEFFSISDWNNWASANSGAIQGTFYIQVTNPSETNRVEFPNHSHMSGDLTIVTNAPIFTASLDDSGVSNSAVFTAVSHYTPPANSSCDYNHDSSECAIHVKNNFSTACTTVALIYADNGPVAIKNDQRMCGSIIGNGMDIKNNQLLNYDERIKRRPGFGRDTWEIAAWQEYPPS